MDKDTVKIDTAKSKLDEIIFDAKRDNKGKGVPIDEMIERTKQLKRLSHDKTIVV